MELALARSRGVRLCGFLTTFALLGVLLCLAPLPGARAEEAKGPATIKIPVTEIDAVPATQVVGQLPSITVQGLALAQAGKPVAALPAESVTRHSLALPDRTLSFTAKAGAVVFEDEKGAAVAEIGYFAYLLDGADARKRPITFVINGGPGAASAWLHIGALGPWRLPITPETAHPTAAADLLPNAETWLDFTDLVFIDPAGTGYSRLHQKTAAARPDAAKDTKAEAGVEAALKRRIRAAQDAKPLRDKFWSVQGDIASIVVFIKRWLEANGRLESPRVFLGESYGGFRAPRVAQSLQATPGFALNGVILVSPALSAMGADFPGLASILAKVSQFPSLAATIADGKGRVSPQQLAAFEREAAGGYLADLLAGPRDKSALDRLAARMAATTGLDADTVRHLGPRSAPQVFLGAIDRKSGRTHSNYDATAKRYAAYDGPTLVDGGDDLGGLSKHLSRAMADLGKRHLTWKPEREYYVRGPGVSWIWTGQESVSALRSVLVRDPTFRVLVAHGYADLVTPYFRSKLLLDQMPTIGTDNRVRLEVYGGGHMFYSRDDSRALFRKHAIQFYEEMARRAD